MVVLFANDGFFFKPSSSHQGENPFCMLSRYGVFLLIAIFYAVANLNLKSVQIALLEVLQLKNPVFNISALVCTYWSRKKLRTLRRSKRNGAQL